jgi:AraC-like DNA-binding protein
VLLLRNHIDKFISSHEYSSKLNNLNRLENIFKYIDSNYNKKISTLELSNQIHLSSLHFCRLFKQITGKTSVEYINEIRLQKSIEMMKNHNMNITEVASHCGFDNINYFSRLFKKHYKISPSKYRQQYLR